MDWSDTTVRIDWTRCTRRRWPPTPRLDFTPQERRKSRNVLLYWWAGRGQRRLPTGLTPIHAGLCHWARPGWTYECTQRVRNPLGVTAIHFDLLDERGAVLPPDCGHLPPEQLLVRAPRLAEDITHWIAERAMDAQAGMTLARQTEQAGEYMLRGMLITLAQDTPLTPNVQPSHDGRIDWRSITTYIQDHLHELDRVDELAAKAGYTRSHFSRLFRQQIGLSPQQYIINSRIALAQELLSGTTLSVSAIAARAGYGDIFSFSKGFKQRAGVSPLQYRMRSRSAGEVLQP